MDITTSARNQWIVGRQMRGRQDQPQGGFEIPGVAPQSRGGEEDSGVCLESVLDERCGSERDDIRMKKRGERVNV